MSANLNFNITGGQPFQRAVPTEEIRRQLLGQLPSVLQYLLPSGRIRNHTFYIGDIDGVEGESLKIELQGPKAGMWHDFSTDEGGDIFDLWARKKNFNTTNEFPKLIEDIQHWLGIYEPFQNVENSSVKKSPANDDLGEPTAKWDYKNEDDSKIIATVFRYDPKGKSKQFRPYDAINKIYKAPDPRPLYNLPGIATSEIVILVEGEKCAQALIDKGICATTAMNGAMAPIYKTEWSPLKDKDVIIWPDNDEPGKQYAQKAKEKLLEIGTSSVKVIEIPIDKPEKWDVADAVKDGIDLQQFIDQTKVANNNQIERIYDRDLIGTPPPREWIIPDWLPKGCVTAIYGDGGVGKSLLAQQLMAAVATGKSWLRYKNEPMKVYGLLCEDDRDEIHRRQNSINQQLGIKEEDFGNMLYVSRVGKDNLLMTFDKEERGKLTSFFNQLLADIQEFKPQLVVLDTLADLFGGNENIRIQVRQFVQNCCGEIARSVNAAVLLCAHPSDSGLQRKTGTGGSTAWSNTVRSRWYLEKPEEDGVSPDIRILSQKKSNYSAAKEKITLKWEDGIFVRTDDYVTPTAGEKYSSKCDDARDRKSNDILNLIYDEATVGRAYTMSQFSEAFEGAGTKYGLGSKRSIQNRLDTLATRGYIKFFHNGEDYDLPKLPRSKCGYMCIRNMRLKVEKRGEIFIQPTHFKCRKSGNLETEKSPKTWVYL
jgi:DNA primase